jgi:hypothetical protein
MIGYNLNQNKKSWKQKAQNLQSSAKQLALLKHPKNKQSDRKKQTKKHSGY